jgi:hypothetical protein
MCPQQQLLSMLHTHIGTHTLFGDALQLYCLLLMMCC